jgi:hypothetical protein
MPKKLKQQDKIKDFFSENCSDEKRLNSLGNKLVGENFVL